MAEIEFHTGVADKPDFACRLLRKAAGRGAKVVVHGDARMLTQLDALLWTFDPQSFVPHLCWLGDATPGEALRQHTPIWLLTDAARSAHHEVLVNLGPELALGFEAFARVIEVVSTADDDAHAGRARWKHYVAQGHTIRHHASAT